MVYPERQRTTKKFLRIIVSDPHGPKEIEYINQRFELPEDYLGVDASRTLCVKAQFEADLPGDFRREPEPDNGSPDPARMPWWPYTYILSEDKQTAIEPERFMWLGAVGVYHFVDYRIA